MTSGDPEQRPAPPPADPPDWPDWLREGLRGRRREPGRPGDAGDPPASARPGFPIRRLLLAVLVVGALAGGLTLATRGSLTSGTAGAPRPSLSLPAPGPPPTPTPRPTPLPTPQVQISSSVAGGLDVAAVYREAAPGVVNVEGFRSTGSTGSGSGFVLNQQGQILTSDHLVASAERLLVRFSDGGETPARLLGRDPADDLAVVQVAVPLDRLSPLELGDSDSLRPGDPLVLIGNPLGRGQTVSAGLVSAIDRSAFGPGARPVAASIQVDVPIGPSDAGGPLLNGRVQVIGVATTARGSSTAPGLGLPISALRGFIARMSTGEVVRHAYLGVGGRDLTPALAQALSIPAQSGVLVTEVASGSPAAQAGLRPAQDPRSGAGGDIVLALDGQEIRRLDDLTRLLDARRPGDRANVLIRRGPTQLTVPVVLGDWPA